MVPHMFKSSTTSWFLRSVFFGGGRDYCHGARPPQCPKIRRVKQASLGPPLQFLPKDGSVTVHAAEELRKLMVLLIDYHPPDEHDKPAMSIMKKWAMFRVPL